MEYQKTINLLDDTMYQPSKFRTRNWVEINEESKTMYDNSNIRFKQTFVGFQDTLKTSLRHVLKTSSAPLQRNNFSSSKTS